jgi:hypothetical protein
MNSAIHHISASQLQADALRATLRNPPPRPERLESAPRRRVRLVRRLRPIFA